MKYIVFSVEKDNSIHVHGLSHLITFGEWAYIIQIMHIPNIYEPYTITRHSNGMSRICMELSLHMLRVYCLTETNRVLSDTYQTLIRHLSDTYQTLIRHLSDTSRVLTETHRRLTEITRDLTETHQRPIRDPSETHQRLIDTYQRPIRD
jgi:hypothetical protein